MNLKVLKLAGFFGIIAPIFGLLLLGMSIWLSPWFTWTGNALSDIGGAEGFESVVFNSGLGMTAALMMMFSTGLFEITKDNFIGQVGSAMYIVSSGLLLGIGLINITIEPFHFYVSLGFFITLPLSAIVLGYFFYIKRMKFYLLLSWGAAILALVIWLLPCGSPAIPEILAVSYMMIWQIILAYWMYSRKEDKLIG